VLKPAMLAHAPWSALAPLLCFAYAWTILTRDNRFGVAG
jgi:hypothetical protein